MTERWRIHPSLRGGSKLERNREHDFPEDPPVDHPMTCARCHFTLPAGEEGKPFCRVMKPGRPSPVSDRREEKKEKRGIYGPLCHRVRGWFCRVPGCTDQSDPAHVRGVGPGYGDFLRIDGRWVGNVVNLCRHHHRFLDGVVGGGGSPDAFMLEYGVDVRDGAREIGDDWMERNEIDPTDPLHPYAQLEGAA